MESKLREIRKNLGYTQAGFANALGVTRACIANYEAGRREPDTAFFAKLKEKFNVSEKAIGEIIIAISEEKNVGRED